MSKNLQEKKTTFAQQVEGFTSTVFEILISLAPLMVFVIMLSATAGAINLEYRYQQTVLGDGWAELTSFVTAGFRFVLGVLTMYLITRRAYVPAFFTTLIVLSISAVAHFHAGSMAATFAGGEGVYLIQSLIWVAVISEFLLIVVKSYMSGNFTLSLPSLWKKAKKDETV